MRNKNIFNIMLRSAAALGAIACAQTSLAQEATSAGAGASAADNEEIVVTALRREQKLQDAPVAVTAITGEAVEKSGIRSLKDIQYLAPSVQYKGGSDGGFQMRGVATQGFDYSLDKSVGVMIDGVVQAIPRDPILSSLSDVGQVEVLRGPQGTLYGKNTSAGLIIINTRKPELGSFGFDGHFTYGTDNERVLQGNLNIPLGDTAALRISAHNQHRDGYGVNRFNDWELGKVDDWGVRAKLLWQPTDVLEVYLIGSYQKTEDTSVFITIRQPAPGSAFPALYAPYGATIGPKNEDIVDDVRPENRNHVWSGTGTINYQLGDHTLTSVTGYRKFDATEVFGTDSSPVNIIDTNNSSVDASQFTQELRLTSPNSGFMTYVLGLYYFDAKTEATQHTAGQFGIPAFLIPLIYGPGITQLSARNGIDFLGAYTKSYAAFGQFDFHINDNLTAFVGGRYTKDKVRSVYFQTPVAGEAPANPATVKAPNDTRTSASNFSFRLGGQYKFTPDIMAYATYSKGYKGPAVANISGEALKIRPEKSDAYEVGLKSEFLDRRVTINIAAFYQKYKDFQATVYDTTVVPAAFRLGNAGGLETKGFEVEMNVRPATGLNLNAAVTYAPSRFTDYVAACYAGQPISTTPGVGCNLVAGSYVQDMDGQPLNAVSDLSFALGANYRHSITNDLMLDMSTNYIWRDDSMTISPDPNTTVKAYGLLSANIGIGPENGKWRLGLFGRNLLDNHFVSAIFTSVADPFLAPFGTPPGYSQTTTVEARRTVGVMLDLKF